MCPAEVRVMAWVKPFVSWKKGVYPPYAWEPVLMLGGRNRFGHTNSPRDWVSATPPVFTGKGRGTKGQKPDGFCDWLFDCLGATPEDELVDLFPGSGAVGDAWHRFLNSPRIDFAGGKDEQIEMDAA